MCKLTELVFRERVFLFLVHYPASLNWGGGVLNQKSFAQETEKPTPKPCGSIGTMPIEWELCILSSASAELRG